MGNGCTTVVEPLSLDLRRPIKEEKQLKPRRSGMIDYDTQGVIVNGGINSHSQFDEIQKLCLFEKWNTLNIVDFVSSWSADLLLRYTETSVWLSKRRSLCVSQLFQWITSTIQSLSLEDVEKRTIEFLDKNLLSIDTTELKCHLTHIENSFLSVLEQTLQQEKDQYNKELWNWWSGIIFDCMERILQRRTIALSARNRELTAAV